MALDKEDKADVSRVFGKKTANAIRKATLDTPAAHKALDSKKMGKKEVTGLNAWGQDDKTAKMVRSNLRKEKKMKSFMKGASARFDAGY